MMYSLSVGKRVCVSFLIKKLTFLMVLGSLFVGPAFSAEILSEADLVQQLNAAKELYQKRSSTESAPTDQAIAKLSKLEQAIAELKNRGDNLDSDLNYDVLLLLSKSLYWRGQHLADKNEKMKVHELGQAKADEAIKVDDSYADAYYYAGIHLSRWGEANGVVPSLFKLPTLKSYMAEVVSHVTRDGNRGETLDGFGADRVFGRIYTKLPTGIAGASHAKAIEHLKRAFENARNLAMNVVYYAEALNAGDSTERAYAIKILDEILKSDPSTFNPSRTPETIEEFKLAKAVRDQIRQ